MYMYIKLSIRIGLRQWYYILKQLNPSPIGFGWPNQTIILIIVIILVLVQY